MLDANEFFRFLLALALTPVVMSLGRGLRLESARVPFLVALGAMLFAFGSSAYAGPTLLWLRALRHLAFAVGGAGLAVAAWRARRQILAESGPDAATVSAEDGAGG